MMTCPACNQEVGDTGLGTSLPHRVQGSQEFCVGFVMPNAIAPSVMAVPEGFTPPGRKVRSDKGTKRGQRKRGGDAYVPGPEQNSLAAGVQAAPGGPPSQEPERVAAKPPTKVEDWMKITPRTSITALDSTMGDAVPKPHGSHVADARAGYVATAPDWQPLIHATYDEADDAATEALRGAAERVIIYWVTPFEEISNGLIRKRLGRVRRGKP